MNAYDSTKAYARMSLLLDIFRGDSDFVKWDDLDKEEKQMYIDDANASKYVITENDVKDIEEYIFRLRKLATKTIV